MTAIDTDVLVRFLVRDDAAQAETARKLIEAGAVFVPLTVCLETDWVLRSAYGFSRPEVAGALRAFAGLPGVEMEAAGRLVRALACSDAGMDLADALHVLASGEQDFATFDQALIRKSASLGLTGVRGL